MSPKVIAHIDMDAFFASVEQEDNPSLKGRPVVIGADPQAGSGRGVVSTCSYEARAFGIHSAMPISQAYRLCPKAIFLRGRYRRYQEISQKIFDIFYHFTPDVEPVSIDEAFLDITGTYHFYQTSLGLCQEIKKCIKQETHLTASIGIAPVKMVSKIASDLCKPDGLLEIAPEGVLDFLWRLPVQKLWGVGPKTQKILNRMGFLTIGDLARADRKCFRKNLGETGEHLHDLAHGIDPRNVETQDEVKSISHEHTFEQDTCNQDEIQKTILLLSEKVSHRLRRENLKGKTVSLKLRLKGFKTYTRTLTLAEPTNFVEDIYATARKLFDSLYHQGTWIRLLGIRVTNFKNLYVRESLFEDQLKIKKERVHHAVDLIKNKFGEEMIHRAIK